MNQNYMASQQFPSHRLLPLGSLAPFALAAIAAGTFFLALELRSDRSPLRGKFDLLWDKPSPNRFQHWYVPVIGAGTAGLGAELVRTVISFLRVGVPLPRNVLLGAASLGAVEGLLIALTLALGFGVSSVNGHP